MIRPDPLADTILTRIGFAASRAPDTTSGFSGSEPGTSPIGHESGSHHHEHMDVIVEEIVSAYIGPYASPGLVLAAAASIVVFLTGLGARIVELAQASRWARRGRNQGTVSPDVTADRSPHSRPRIAANMNRRSRPLHREPSDKIIGGVHSVKRPAIHPLCVLNGLRQQPPNQRCTAERSSPGPSLVFPGERIAARRL